MITPAAVGPSKRALLTSDELSAMALGRSSRLTSWTTSDWRAGMSKALTIPRLKATAMRCHT
jgi:hypothetical protein